MKPLTIPAEAWKILRDKLATRDDLERAGAILSPIIEPHRYVNLPLEITEAICLLSHQRHRIEGEERELSALVGFTEILLEGVRRELPAAHPCRRAFDAAYEPVEAIGGEANLYAFRGAMSQFLRLDDATRRKIAGGWRLEPKGPDLQAMLDWRDKHEPASDLVVRDELVIDGGFYAPGETHFRRVWSLLYYEDQPIRLHVRAGTAQEGLIAFLESALHIARDAFATAQAMQALPPSEALRTEYPAQQKSQAPNDGAASRGKKHRQHVGALARG